MLSFILSNINKKTLGIIGGVLIVIGIMFYIKILKSDLQNEIDARKSAENDVVLISREYELLYKTNSQLELEYAEQAKFNMIAIQVMKDQHVKELKFRERVTQIKTEIKNVEPNEDGKISNILANTLNALRLLD